MENPVNVASKKPQRGNLMFACMGPYLQALTFGYMIGYSSPAIPDLIRENVITEEEGLRFGSIATLGGLLGCPLAGWLMEKLGRKRTLLCTSIPCLLGWICIAFGGTFNAMVLGRILTGVSSGFVTVVAGVYVAETTPKELRGMLGSGVQLFITIGILLVYTLGLFMDWKSMACVGMLPPFFACMVIVRIPDTPRFHLLKNDKISATKSLSWFLQTNDVDEEIRDIEESLPDPSEKVAWSDFLKPQLSRPLQVSLGLMLFQQLTGINIVMFYTVSIFESAGFKGNGQMATVVVGLAQVVCTLLACVLMDRAGRRKLLTVAGIGMGSTCLALAYCFHTGAENAGSFSLVSLVLYIVAFSLGWGPIPMLVMSEVFPVKARGPATALACITSWLSAFIVTSSYSTLLAMFNQSGAFVFFALCCFISMIFVLKIVPETKGKSLEDIELYFLGRTLRGVR